MNVITKQQGRECGGSAFDSKSLILSYSLVALFAATRMWQLATYELWWDEVMSVEAARLGWNDLFMWVVSEIVHPPLFYFFLKLWVNMGGETLVWLKLFPALTAFAAIIPFFLFCKELRLDAAEMNMALSLMAVNSYLIYYAQEVRMYSLVFLLSLCSFWLFMRFVNGQGQRLRLSLLFVANLFLVYTHVFGWLVVLAQAIHVLLFERSKLISFSVNVLVLVASFAPWVLLVVQSALAEKRQIGANIVWIQKPSLITLASFYNGLHGPFENRLAAGLGMLLFVFPVVLWIRHAFKGTDMGARRLLCGLGLLSFLPSTAAFVASHVLRTSIFGERYLIICAAPYLILVSVAVCRVPLRRLRTVYVSLMLVWAVSSFFYQQASVDRRIDWSTIVDTMLAAESAKAARITLYVFEPIVAHPVHYYLKSSGLGERFDIQSVDGTAALTGSQFWVAYRNNQRWKKEAGQASVVKGRNCQVGREVRFGASGQEIILLQIQSCL